MSVIMESLEGDTIVFIAEGYACEDGVQFSLKNATKFSIADRVRYVGEYKDRTSKQDYLAWKIRFKTEDGRVFSATQGYFLTVDEWSAIEKHFKTAFAKRQTSNPKKRSVSKSYPSSKGEEM